MVKWQHESPIFKARSRISHEMREIRKRAEPKLALEFGAQILVKFKLINLARSPPAKAHAHHEKMHPLADFKRHRVAEFFDEFAAHL